MSIYEQIPFPEVVKEPSALVLELQRRIKFMFGIDVEPSIIRHPGSYYKTRAFRYLWSMKTPCGRYEIACFEPARVMAVKPAWHVIDWQLLAYRNEWPTTGKVIY
jgi:hypothetical protein